MTLKKGNKGNEVADLQQQLVAAGYPTAIDGWFGVETEHALKAFQREHMITATGQAGTRTMTALAGKPLGNQLTIHDMQCGADILSVSLATMATVAQVESVGEGFCASMRPAVLFERHVFHRQLMKYLEKHEVERLSSHFPDLINTLRGGYQGGEKEWGRLSRAMAIHQPAAIESASWGMFQVMGFHWSSLSYTSSTEWCDAMCRSEVEQLVALCRFIKQDPAMHHALRHQHWAEFARRYNGPAYKSNHYDEKLANAYAHFVREYP